MVEDAAQAHLRRLDGRPVGTFGAAAAFSFYPTKNMTAGEGGLVACADESVARKIRLLRNQGMERRYENEVVGYNMRMTDLHAAIGRVQLRRLPGWTVDRRRQRRHSSAPRWPRRRRRPGCHCRRWPPARSRSGTSTRSGLPQRDRGAGQALPSGGSAAGVYYPIPIHRLPAFGLDLGLPQTDRAAAEVLSLPVHPALSQEQLEHVVAAVTEAVTG